MQIRKLRWFELVPPAFMPVWIIALVFSVAGVWAITVHMETNIEATQRMPNAANFSFREQAVDVAG